MKTVKSVSLYSIDENAPTCTFFIDETATKEDVYKAVDIVEERNDEVDDGINIADFFYDVANELIEMGFVVYIDANTFIGEFRIIENISAQY